MLDVRGPELLRALECRPLVVKPNREELALTLRRDLRDDVALHDAMREICSRGAQWVVVTSGVNPAWACSQGKLYRFEVAQVSTLNPIGSGDCLMAGLAQAVLNGQPLPDAIQLGMAAAAENATHLLPGDFDRSAVLNRQRAMPPYVVV
jgi:fructose-1-phosphate kinase PfkB-like protein